MYTKQKYLRQSEKEILEQIKRQGFDPQKFTDESNYIYEPHLHKETKLLVFLEGKMEVFVDNKEFECTKGDELIISSNIIHSAKVVSKGCTFFWSEKVI